MEVGVKSDKAKALQRIFLVLAPGVVILIAWNAWVAVPVFFALKDEPDVRATSYRRWFVSPPISYLTSGRSARRRAWLT